MRAFLFDPQNKRKYKLRDLMGSNYSAPIKIGRAGDCDIHPGIGKEDYRTVSRYHASVFSAGNDIWISDLGSSNTTIIQHKGREDITLREGRLVPLEHGQKIVIGGCSLVYRESLFSRLLKKLHTSPQSS